MIWKILFALVVTLFFVGLWVGCWLLRGGPEGPNGWMFLPVFVQQMGLLGGCMGLGFKAFSDAA